jgi:membrane-associated phospholipid phosphatase
MGLLEFSVVLAILGALVIVVGRIPAFASLRAKLPGRQRYAHPIPTLVLASLVPVYMIINVSTRGRAVFVPELALDRAVPLQPAWTLVYGSMYVFAFLPAFVVREVTLRRRAVLAYIMVALVSYVGFLVYPTVGPRPERVIDEGFFAWSLQFHYAFDPPYNCFPSLHVAYAFVAALTCYRMHRELGTAAIAWATLIGVSTLYTKQHYVIDVVAGALSAYVAYLIFLRSYPRAAVAEADRQRAPRRALAAVGVYGVVIIVFVIAYYRRIAA